MGESCSKVDSSPYTPVVWLRSVQVTSACMLNLDMHGLLHHLLERERKFLFAGRRTGRRGRTGWW